MSYETSPCPLLGKPDIKHKYEFKGLMVLSNAEFSFASAVSQSVAANGGTYTIPTGIWYVDCAATTKVQLNNGTSWIDLCSNAGKVLVISDGVNVRLYNSNTSSAETSKLIKIA